MPPLTRSTAKIKRQFRSASVLPATVDAEKRTVELTWSKGAMGRRYDWRSGEVVLEGLSMDPAHIRMERLNNGAPLLDAHNSWSNKSVIGVVEKAWIEGDEGRALVRFSKDQDADRIFQKVLEGVLRNISVGYDVHEYTEQPRKENDKYRTVIATDWEPMEISVVPIGFDDDAKVRGAEATENDCVIHQLTKETETMPPIQQENQTTTVDVDAERKKAAEEAIKAERERASQIRSAALSLGLDAAEAEKHVASGATVEIAQRALIDAAAARNAAIQTSRVELTDNTPDMVRDMGTALMHRATGKGELTAGVREFRNQSLVGLARTMLSKAGVKTSMMTDNDVAMEALRFRSGAHSMADFPHLLANVGNKIVREGFQMGTTSYELLRQEREVGDFKEITSVSMAELGKFERTSEGGQFKKTVLSDKGEKYKLGTFGRIVYITRQAIINNDFDFLAKLWRNAGIEGRELLADLVFGAIIDNPKMGDGATLFHEAKHKNGKFSGGAAPDETGLSAGREAMRCQVGEAGGRPLNLVPRFLLVPAALETKALQLTNKEMLPNQAGNVNTFRTQLEPIVEARLDVKSKKAWYMTVDGRVNDLVELAFLSGHKEVQTVVLPQTDVDAIGVKSFLDAAAAPIDFRGAYYNKGEA